MSREERASYHNNNTVQKHFLTLIFHCEKHAVNAVCWNFLHTMTNYKHERNKYMIVMHSMQCDMKQLFPHGADKRAVSAGTGEAF